MLQGAAEPVAPPHYQNVPRSAGIERAGRAQLSRHAQSEGDRLDADVLAGRRFLDDGRI